MCTAVEPLLAMNQMMRKSKKGDEIDIANDIALHAATSSMSSIATTATYDNRFKKTIPLKYAYESHHYFTCGCCRIYADEL